MEPTPLWDHSSLIAIAVACLAVFLGVSLLIYGWSMKLACRICGVDDIEFGYAILITICSGAAGVAASLAVTLGASAPSPAVASLLPMLAVVIAIAVLVRTNPFRAFGIYVVHSILGTIAILLVAVPMVIAAAYLIPPSLREDLSAHAANTIDRSSLLASATAIGQRREAAHARDPLPEGGAPADSSLATDPETAHPAAAIGIEDGALEALQRALYRDQRAESSGSTAASGSAAVNRPNSPDRAGAPGGTPPPLAPARAVMPPGVERNPFVQ